ncbi:hypothetical protein ACS0TY_003392 [Phlomoides rotata]
MEWARRKISVDENQPSSFPSLLGPKAMQSFLAKSSIFLSILLKARDSSKNQQNHNRSTEDYSETRFFLFNTFFCHSPFTSEADLSVS